jgi:hypothetical protein
VQANASPDRSDSVEQLRRERTRIRQCIRRWQKQCDRDSNEPSSGPLPGEQWRERLDQIPRQLQELRKSQQARGSRTDPESRYLRQRGGFCLGYTAEVAVSDDHLIVAQRVHQGTTDNASLQDMTEACQQQCGGEPPQAVMADCGYYAMEPIRTLQARGIDVYVPDRLMATELAGGERAPEMNHRQQRRTPGLKQLRERLRDPAVGIYYARRKALVEPVFGVLKQQRGMRQFRRRGLSAVRVEWTLATTAFNVTRLFQQRALT